MLSPSVKVEEKKLEIAKYSDKVSTPLLLESVLHEIEIIPSSKVYTQSTTLNFKNYSDRKLEGDLVFPLPEGATICGYSLQIGQDLVEATIVEKKKAQKTFDKEVTRGNLVTLIEQVVGNQYKTKIYPWEPNSTKTVKLDFISDLKMCSDGVTLDIPIETSKHEKLTQVCISINVNGEEEPILEQHKLSKKDNKYSAEFSQDELKNVEMFTVTVPLKSTNPLSVEYNPLFDQYYFDVSETINTVAKEEIKQGEQSISIIWDTSLSRETQVDQFKKKEFVLLQEFLQTGSFKVDLYTFSNTLKNEGTFTKADDVIKALESLCYDGGTNIYQLGSLNLSNYDYSLLFTDGIDNLTEKKSSPIKFKSSSPIFSFNSSMSSNQSLINYISEITGGKTFKLTESNIKTIIPDIGCAPFSFLSAEYDENEVSEVYPSKPIQISDNELFHLNGLLLADKTTIKLNFGYGTEVKKTLKYELSKQQSKKSKIIGILWAKRCLSELDCFNEHYKEEIISIGRQFSLVTSNTSLMVLETLQQHIDHKIEPSKSRKTLHDEYNNHIKSEQNKEQNRTDQKLQKVKRLWEGYLDWYSKDYVGPLMKNLELETLEFDSKTKNLIIKIESIENDIIELKQTFESRLKQKEIDCEMEFNSEKQRYESLINDLKTEISKFEVIISSQNKESQRNSNVRNDREKLNIIKFKKYESEDLMSGKFSVQEDMSFQNSCISMSRSLSCMSNESKKTSIEQGSVGSIKMKEFNPNVPYIEELKKLKKEDLYNHYLKMRNEYKSSPAFYLDICDYLFKKNLNKESLKVLSNLAELEFDSPQLLRIIGYKLEEIKEYELSIQMFRKVLELKPHEPQSYRDLALVLEKNGKYKEAIQLFYKVITGEWSNAFDEIELTALQELNRSIHFHTNCGIEIPNYLIKHAPLDLRIIMAWDTDKVDIDLHTTEPSGEVVYYGHKNSSMGGLNSRDFTQGYGPETYSIKEAMPGKYIIMAKFYSNHQQSSTGGTTILLTLFTKYGEKEKENCQQITIRLNTTSQEIVVGEIEIKNEKVEFIQKERIEKEKLFKSVKIEFEEKNIKIETLKSEQNRSFHEIEIKYETKIQPLKDELNLHEKILKDKKKIFFK